MVTTVSWGDIVIVILHPTRGSEQRGRRPCLVVQNEVGNENAPTSIIVPLTPRSGTNCIPSRSSCRPRSVPSGRIPPAPAVRSAPSTNGSGTGSGRFLTSGSRRSIGPSSTVSVFVTRPDRGPRFSTPAENLDGSPPVQSATPSRVATVPRPDTGPVVSTAGHLVEPTVHAVDRCEADREPAPGVPCAKT